MDIPVGLGQTVEARAYRCVPREGGVLYDVVVPRTFSWSWDK